MRQKLEMMTLNHKISLNYGILIHNYKIKGRHYIIYQFIIQRKKNLNYDKVLIMPY